MSYRTAAAFRQALEDRLRDHAHRTGLSIGRLRKIIVFDRLLARLVAVAPEDWILKGALALDWRLGVKARTTLSNRPLTHEAHIHYPSRFPLRQMTGKSPTESSPPSWV